MSIPLRIVLIVCAIAIAAFTLIGIRKSRMRIEDSLFWAGLAAVILLLGIFPQIGRIVSRFFGFAATVNFVFAFFILILTVKCFTMSQRNSELENKLKELTQQVAIERLEHHERASDQSDDSR